MSDSIILANQTLERIQSLQKDILRLEQAIKEETSLKIDLTKIPTSANEMCITSRINPFSKGNRYKILKFMLELKRSELYSEKAKWNDNYKGLEIM